VDLIFVKQMWMLLDNGMSVVEVQRMTLPHLMCVQNTRANRRSFILLMGMMNHMNRVRLDPPKVIYLHYIRCAILLWVTDLCSDTIGWVTGRASFVM